MASSPWIPVIAAAIGVLGIALQQWRQRPLLRDHIRADLEIWSALPEGSTSRRALLDAIDQQVGRLLRTEATLRRDPSGMTLGVLMTLIFGWLAWIVWDFGGYFKLLELLVIPLFAMGVFGFAESARRVERDERGRAQRKQAEGRGK